MNGAHIHLLLNHVPVIGSFFTLLLFIYGLSVKSDSIKKAALLMMILSTLIGIPAYLSGEEAEDVVRNVAGINIEAAEAHEEMAHTAFRIMILTGSVALFTFFYKPKSKLISIRLIIINAILILATFILMARTGFKGGEIRHSEIHIEESGL